MLRSRARRVACDLATGTPESSRVPSVVLVASQSGENARTQRADIYRLIPECGERGEETALKAVSRTAARTHRQVPIDLRDGDGVQLAVEVIPSRVDRMDAGCVEHHGRSSLSGDPQAIVHPMSRAYSMSACWSRRRPRNRRDRTVPTGTPMSDAASS